LFVGRVLLQTPSELHDVGANVFGHTIWGFVYRRVSPEAEPIVPRVEQVRYQFAYSGGTSVPTVERCVAVCDALPPPLFSAYVCFGGAV